MKLQFLRSSCLLEIQPSRPLIYQFESPSLFSRVVQSLLSELGEDAIEPYVVWDSKDKRINPKKAFLVMNSLPCIPVDDSLSKALFQRIDNLFKGVPDLKSCLEDDWAQLQKLILGTNQGYNGFYTFNREFDLIKLLKLFGYSPLIDLSNELLDNCMRYLELCADAQLDKPIVFVNAFRFFTENELVLLFEKAKFNGISLLLLESGINRKDIQNTRYIVVDQHFLEY